MLTLMLEFGIDMIYGRNHTFQGLSVHMEGGIKRYLVTRLDYGSGFDKLLMDSNSVHLILFVKHDILPLGLAHNSFALYCHLWFIRLGSAQKDGHRGDLQNVR